MSRSPLVAATFAASALIAAPAFADPVRIVAAENFYGDVAGQIGGANVAVTSILSNPDDDPHLFEASPATARALTDAKVVIVSTGGLSHQLDGERAGFINPEFDALCLDALINDPIRLTRYTAREIVELSGTQGLEILNWITGRGILGGRAHEVVRKYHVPISNTASAVQLLAPN